MQVEKYNARDHQFQFIALALAYLTDMFHGFHILQRLKRFQRDHTLLKTKKIPCELPE